MESTRIGVLGGGQLAQMLGEALRELNSRRGSRHSWVVYSDSARCPAARTADEVIVGSLGDEAALGRFFSKVDVVVFENEFVDCAFLRRVASRYSVRFAPELETIALLQDKCSQKQLAEELAIPTAAFEIFEGGDRAKLEAWVGSTLSRHEGRCVFKWGKLGYDGKGVFLAQDPRSDLTRATEFCLEATRKGNRVFVEERIAFGRELAIVACLSPNGFAAYPVVISTQKKGVCHRVIGPARNFGLSADREAQAVLAAKKVAQKAKLVGAFALEFFEAESGELVLNEIAPRVHNSGHYTQDAAASSQFTNHLLAALDLPLEAMTTNPAFAMINLLGPEGLQAELEAGARPPQPERPEVKLHWYDKTSIKPGRKLGHVNGSVDSPARLDELCRLLEDYVQGWEAWLRRKK